VHALRARESALERQNMRLHAAVSHMPQGLCMFDSESHLVVSNSNFAAIYGLPASLVRPGTSFEDIFAYGIARGMQPAGGGDAFLQRHRQRIADCKPGTELLHLADGRTISMMH